MSKLTSILLALLLTGCAYHPFTLYDYKGKHPEFPIRKPVRDTWEYQITIHRSWRDSLYVIAGNSLYGELYIGYSISNWQKETIKPLSFTRISKSDWGKIQDAFKKLDYFNWDVPCWEKAYKENSLLVPEEDGSCGAIVLTDGGTLSMLAVTPTKIKGIEYVSTSDEDDLVHFADVILEIAGVNSKRIPKWGF